MNAQKGPQHLLEIGNQSAMIGEDHNIYAGIKSCILSFPHNGEQPDTFGSGRTNHRPRSRQPRV